MADKEPVDIEIADPENHTDSWWYARGNEYRRQSDWKHALDCYMEAIDINPDSPAVEAKAMLEDILNFYNKDAYNP